FKQNKIAPTGNFKLFSKTAILVVSIVLLYLALVTEFFSNGWVNVFLCMLMGVNVAAIGFNVMHDGAHGSYSKHKWINEIMGHSLNILGGSVFMWKQKHNIAHHTYTNIEGHDDDIDAGSLLRIHKDQPKLAIHRFQHIYGLFLYGFLYGYWVFYTDYYKYFTGQVSDNVPLRKMKTHEHIVFWVSKVVNLTLSVIIPIVLLGFTKFIIGYVIMLFTGGVVISVVFQLAHIVEEAHFFAPDTKGLTVVEAEWAVYQLNTTVDFAPNSRFLTWLLGGLNFQVIHHLFPKISHVHYPEIRKIVQQTCDEYKINYRTFPTMWGAFKSHMTYLKQTGNAA
ncbi:MAG: acyl-CoA desaturase, partial [Bacteroidetes bacterium]|nr:acyl-CoA desaturase [Bacteroidota bacterium]